MQFIDGLLYFNLASIPFVQNLSLIGDIRFSPEDILDAIDEIDTNSSTTDNDVPALVLKECKTMLSYPIYLIWQTSFQNDIISGDHKDQVITPVFKEGDKSDAGNYRPISSTSHIKKIFESHQKKSC